MTRPIVAASFLAGITAAGLTVRAAMRRWFTVARQVEQAPLEPYLPPRQSPTHPAVANPLGWGESAGRMVLESDEALRVITAAERAEAQRILNRAFPEVGR